MTATTILISVATIVVSVCVLAVQYAQWRTANQKVVIDLYDRRLRVYSQIETAIGRVLREGKVTPQAFNDFAIGQADARFLFGDEIQEYLKEYRKYFAWMISFTDSAIDQSPDRQALIEKKYDYLNRTIAFYDNAPQLFEPYIKMTQKNTPFWRPW